MQSRTDTEQESDPVPDRVSATFEELRKLIRFHRLAPGTPLIQAQVARKLSQSRATVRAALQLLAREGYVVETGLGTYSRFIVAALTVPDMQELFEIVGALEGVVARRCALLSDDERRRVTGRMEEINRQVMVMVEEARVEAEEVNRLDREFHQTFLRLAAGSRVKTIHDSIQPQFERYRDLYLERFASRMRSLGASEHAEIVLAIGSGDPDRAQQAVEGHWRSGAKRLAAVIEEFGERRGYSWG